MNNSNVVALNDCVLRRADVTTQLSAAFQQLRRRRGEPSWSCLFLLFCLLQQTLLSSSKLFSEGLVEDAKGGSSFRRLASVSGDDAESVDKDRRVSLGRRSYDLPVFSDHPTLSHDTIQDWTYLQAKYRVEARNNLCLNKPTVQSSTNHKGTSNRAVDGNREGHYFYNSCTHTHEAMLGVEHAYWQVQLAREEEREPTVGVVAVYNRKDCCHDRLSNFVVSVGNSSDGSDHQICGFRVSEVDVGSNTFVECTEPLKGRFLRVTSYAGKPLTLCEVEAYELLSTPTSTGNIAAGRPTRQSGTWHGGYSWKAVDTDQRSMWTSNSCMHSADLHGTAEEASWWSVELAGLASPPATVSTVVIYNRRDCCADRLLDAVITLGFTHDGQGHVECGRVTTLSPDGVEVVHCNGGAKRGHILRIYRTGEAPLNFCEVEVFSKKNDMCKSSSS